jgi:transcriptional regulator with XRE-family HTH domain
MARPTGTDQLKALGELIRAQRKAAELSLRELAERANVSNPYISQIERGLHEPSMRVLRSISQALNLPIEFMLAKAGLTPDGSTDARLDVTVEAAIAADDALTSAQRDSLIAVYRNFVTANQH